MSLTALLQSIELSRLLRAERDAARTLASRTAIVAAVHADGAAPSVLLLRRSPAHSLAAAATATAVNAESSLMARLRAVAPLTCQLLDECLARDFWINTMPGWRFSFSFDRSKSVDVETLSFVSRRRERSVVWPRDLDPNARRHVARHCRGALRRPHRRHLCPTAAHVSADQSQESASSGGLPIYGSVCCLADDVVFEQSDAVAADALCAPVRAAARRASRRCHSATTSAFCVFRLALF